MRVSFRSRSAWLQLTMLVLVFIVNTLAVTLPINGYTPGAISALFPNLFVPAGFTFSIWSVIYLLQTGYVIRSASVLEVPGHARNVPLKLRVQLTMPYFIGSSLLNVAWLFAWHYLQIGLSLLIMLALLLTLLALYRNLLKTDTAITGLDRLFLHTGFVVYLGWISVATIANTTALLVYLQWGGWGIEPAYWSTAMLLVALLLAAFMSLYRHEMAFAAVIAWAAFGIYKAQFVNSELVGYTAMAVAATALLLSGYAWWRRHSRTPLEGVI